MLRVFYSNRTEELLRELATRVRAQQLRDGPLLSVSIVVPSMTIESDVRLSIARTCGVAANLDVSLLTCFASEIIAKVAGERVADASSLEAMALTQILDAQALASPELAPVRAYLHGAGEETADAFDVRSVQLAARIGRVFEEYTYSRGELLAAWRTGLVLGEAAAEVESWQRHMYLAMFGAGGLAERRSAAGAARVVPLCDAVARLEIASSAVPRAVHVFGFAHFARSFHLLLERLGHETEVVVYALSACEGFWEDLEASDPELLLLWGRPGRDQARALNAISSFDHDDRFVDPLIMSSGRGDLLHTVQRDILRRRSPAEVDTSEARPEGDDSITMLEHASIRRELEAVVSEIWRLCRADERARFDDFAVLVPEADAEAYAALVPTVFREAHDLPHRTVGMGANEDRVAEAIELLLSLPLGRFTRQEVLRVAVHPLVVASVERVAGAGEIEARQWIDWSDALGIVSGADRGDHDGTYVTRDVLNWDQGLRRLALGSFMAGDATGERSSFRVGDRHYVPHEIPSSEVKTAAAFGLLSRSLIEDARFARRSELTMPEWASFLRLMVEAYVTPTDRTEQERLTAALRRLGELSDLDLGSRRLRYRAACEIARTRLATMPAGRGTEGVVVSTPSAVRGLPFRFVFACGMGEGRFPSPEVDDSLDLRWAHRRDGDVTARERDRYAFLELLLGTRDRLVLSYVSRDAMTGDALAPSSVVQELMHTLARTYRVDPTTLRRQHPLRRWDPAYFPEIFAAATGRPGLGTMCLQEARAEARTLALRRSAESAGARVSREEVLRRAREESDWSSLAEHLRLAALPDAPPRAEDRLAIPLYAVVRFLEFPLQGWARFRLGLDELEDEDVMSREDELFETPLRDATLLLRGVFLDAAAAKRPVELVYDEEVVHRELRGTGPSGPFARAERDDHVATLRAWHDGLEASGVDPGAIELCRFGRAGELARADRVYDAIAIDVDVVDRAGVMRRTRVELGGRVLPLAKPAETSLLLSRRRKATKKDDWAHAETDRLFLRAFVEHAALSASGQSADRPRESIVLLAQPDGATSTERVTFAPLSRDEATVWLRDVVRDLLQGPHAYFFPCEAVFAHARRDAGGPLGPWVERARQLLGDDDDRGGLRSSYGPIPRPAQYGSPDEASAQIMARRRFGLMLERRSSPP